MNEVEFPSGILTHVTLLHSASISASQSTNNARPALKLEHFTHIQLQLIIMNKPWNLGSSKCRSWIYKLKNRHFIFESLLIIKNNKNNKIYLWLQISLPHKNIVPLSNSYRKEQRGEKCLKWIKKVIFPLTPVFSPLPGSVLRRPCVRVVNSILSLFSLDTCCTFIPRWPLQEEIIAWNTHWFFFSPY